MKVLYSKTGIHPLLQMLAEAHLRNYNVIYCDDNNEPLEIEEVEDLVKPRTYKEIGYLVDLLNIELTKAYENGEICKKLSVTKVLIEDNEAEIFVSSDYFVDRLGYEIDINGDFFVRICPWADENFLKPFFSAYEEWISEMVKQDGNKE